MRIANLRFVPKLNMDKGTFCGVRPITNMRPM